MKKADDKTIAKRLLWLWIAVGWVLTVSLTYLEMKVPSFSRPWPFLVRVILGGGIWIPLIAAMGRHAKAANMKGLAGFAKFCTIVFYLWVALGLVCTILLMILG